MKAAAVTLASLAVPAFALASARPGGEGFRIVRRAGLWDDFCNQAFIDAEAKCREERNGEGFHECYLVGQNASMECLVDHSRVPEASDAAHTQCRAEAVKGARDCYDSGRENWGNCYNEQLEAYPDCVKKNNVTTASGQSQTPAGTASTVATTSTQPSPGACSGAAQPPAESQAPQDPPRESPQMMEDKLCSTSKGPNKYGVKEDVCRRNVWQCVFEESKKNPKVSNFDGVIECMDKRASSTGLA